MSTPGPKEFFRQPEALVGSLRLEALRVPIMILKGGALHPPALAPQAPMPGGNPRPRLGLSTKQRAPTFLFISFQKALQEWFGIHVSVDNRGKMEKEILEEAL